MNSKTSCITPWVVVVRWPSSETTDSRASNENSQDSSAQPFLLLVCVGRCHKAAAKCGHRPVGHRPAPPASAPSLDPARTPRTPDTANDQVMVPPAANSHTTSHRQYAVSDRQPAAVISALEARLSPAATEASTLRGQHSCGCRGPSAAGPHSPARTARPTQPPATPEITARVHCRFRSRRWNVGSRLETRRAVQPHLLRLARLRPRAAPGRAALGHRLTSGASDRRGVHASSA